MSDPAAVRWPNGAESSPSLRSNLASIDGVAVSTVSPDTGRAHLVYVSENLSALTGYQTHQLLGQRPDFLFDPETPKSQKDAIAALVERGEQAVVHINLTHAEGGTVPVQANFLSVPSLSQGWPYFLALYRDLSPRPSREKLLNDHADMLDELARGVELPEVLTAVADRANSQLNDATTWIALADADGVFQVVETGEFRTELVEEILGFADDQDLLDGPSSVRSSRLPLDLGLELEGAGVHAVWLLPLMSPKRVRQGILAVAHPSRSMPHPSEQQVLGHLGRVISVAIERSATEADLAHQALHDPLTHLPNRTLIMDRLEQAVARLARDGSTMAVLLVDLDRFKSINDVHGAEIGDHVLLETARRLEGSMRLGDAVGRIGSDQFIVLCVAVSGEAGAIEVSERMLRSIEMPIEIVGREPVHTTASVGVVLLDEPDFTAAELISHAEAALDQAIEAGRNQYSIFEEGLAHRARARHEVRKALEVGIENDELVLHYQPLVRVESGAMVGAEALVRWNRPGHGLLPPSEFIEIAEESGLIVPLGAWAIRECCRQLADWPERHAAEGETTTPVISINLSARQLAHDSLLDTVLAAMDDFGIEPEQLTFEVTESMAVEDLQMAEFALNQLEQLGCKIAIDDFGIGYATLDYLKRFSMADTLKVDRSFVDGLGESREDTAIVSASVALADSLGMSVVAEGVETVEQLEFLHQMGCEYAQGYLLSKPVELHEAHVLWHRQTLLDSDVF